MNLVKQQASWQHVLDFTLRLFLSSAVIFALHRGLSFSYLKAKPSEDWLTVIKFFLTGFGSDLWIAWLLAGLFSIPALFLSLRGRSNLYLAINFLLIGLLGAHQSYIEFFGFQMLPFHFTYFMDGSFISANGTAMFLNPRVWLHIAAGLFATVGARSFSWPNSLSPSLKPFKLGQNILMFLGMTVIMGGVHSANIHYRVQLFLDEGLRLNVVERLYESMMEQSIPDQLTRSEWTLLNQGLGKTVPYPEKTGDESRLLYKLLLRDPRETPLSSFGAKLQHFFENRRLTAKPIHIIVVMMESLRAGDVRALSSQNNSDSITPSLDNIISGDSLVWTKAIATGNVTRGGQEALFCGHLSSMTTSIMRKRPHLQLQCLPNILAQQQVPKTHTYWLHGGEGAFDGQKAFWEKQKAGLTMARHDFPRHLPANDWGMGDLSFFKAAWEVLLNYIAVQSPQQSLGMLLSVSNHPPWRLPPDAPEALRLKAQKLSQPSYQTTLYADYALGEWLNRARSSPLWLDSAVIILGDHGQQESPVFAEEKLEPQNQAFLAHIPLIITGGLITSFKAAHNDFSDHRWNNSVVSQADLAPTLALWLGAQQTSFLGEPLFSLRQSPVMSMSGDKVWFPEEAEARPPRDFLSAAKTEQDARFNMIYTRAFLRLIAL